MQYKPEAVKTFEKIEEEFNRTHDDIHLTIESPNDAMTVLKTRFIREDNPDIIGIGGDVNYSNFIDSDMLMDISDYKGLEDIKEAYKEIDKNLEFCSAKRNLCGAIRCKCSRNSLQQGNVRRTWVGNTNYMG